MKLSELQTTVLTKQELRGTEHRVKGYRNETEQDKAHCLIDKAKYTAFKGLRTPSFAISLKLEMFFLCLNVTYKYKI